MRIPKCYICKRSRQDVFLHIIPRYNERMFNRWLDCLKAYGINKKFYGKNKLLLVCDLHFEKRFIKANNRLLFGAYPSLFTLEEIESGEPTIFKDAYPPELIRKKVIPHKDHTYSANTGRPDPVLQVSNPIKKVYQHKQPKSGQLESQPTALKPTSPTQVDTPPAAEDYLEDQKSAEYHLEDASADLTDDTDPVQFSWQNTEQISLDEDDDSLFGDGPSTMNMAVESKTTGDGDANSKNVLKNENHTEYFCDSCSKEIIGFRYTCVQCENFDLCCACEGKLVHPLHYMLRVPEQKPFSEVNSILEAVREKIKLLTEEAQNDSTGLDFELEEIKIEEPEFEEVTVDPFSDVTTADDHTSDVPAHTSEETSHTTHNNDTKASDMDTSGPHSESKAPVKIVMPTDLFLKAFNVKTLIEHTSVSHIEPGTKNTPTILKKARSTVSPKMPDCRVELTRLSKNYTKVKKVPITFSHRFDRPVIEALERRYLAYRRKQNLKSKEAVLSKMPDPLRCVIPGCNSTNVTESFYGIPRNKTIFAVWKTILERRFPEIKLTQDKEGVCHKYVCRHHFENKNIRPDAVRDRFGIPTLFTESEIATKKPEHPISFEQVESEIKSKRISSEVEEYQDEIWLEDESETPSRNPISDLEKMEENTMETHNQDEMWLDETLLELESHN